MKTTKLQSGGNRQFVRSATISFLTITLLAGCSPQKPDPKIAQLENRVVVLESNMQHLATMQSDLLDWMEAEHQAQTNRNVLFETKISIQDIEIEQLQDRYKNLIDVKYDWQPVPNRNGIPVAAYNQIAAAAAREWPGDYEMQLSRINNEVDAWKKLHAGDRSPPK